MQTIIEGSKASHSIISDVCRENHSDNGAFEEAIKRMKDVYDKSCEGWKIGMDAKFHIVLTVERPLNG